jgi:hypothetical protein
VTLNGTAHLSLRFFSVEYELPDDCALFDQSTNPSLSPSHRLLAVTETGPNEAVDHANQQALHIPEEEP